MRTLRTSAASPAVAGAGASAGVRDEAAIVRASYERQLAELRAAHTVELSNSACLSMHRRRASHRARGRAHVQ